MMNPTISVYMTVKNGARWVRSAVRSIQEQTFGDWEFVIVNDGSTDETSAILEDVARRDDRIRVVHTKGIGRGAALNLALSLCRAEFVANIDADDVSHPMRLEIEYSIASRHPDFAVICSEFLVINADEEITWSEPSDNNISIRDVTVTLAYYNPVIHSSILARRNALMAVGGYNEMLRSHLDYDLWVRLAAAGYRVSCVDVALVAKRWHPNQSFEGRDHVRYALQSLRIQARAIRDLDVGVGGWIAMGGRLVWSVLPRTVRAIVHRARHRA